MASLHRRWPAPPIEYGVVGGPVVKARQHRPSCRRNVTRMRVTRSVRTSLPAFNDRDGGQAEEGVEYDDLGIEHEDTAGNRRPDRVPATSAATKQELCCRAGRRPRTPPYGRHENRRMSAVMRGCFVHGVGNMP